MSTDELTKRNKISQKLAPYIFVSPFFIIFALFSLFPILFTLYISLTDWTGTKDVSLVGVQNYIQVFQDTRFYRAVGNTFLFMIMIIPAQIILALFISVMLTSKKVPFVGTFRLMNFLPYITTSVAIGLIFNIMFDSNYGSVNEILMKFGFITEKINWLGEKWPARITIALVTIWKYFGYTAVLFMAGIMSIDKQLYEASEIDGAGKWRQLFSITLPNLKPVMIFVVLTTMIGCFQIFDEPYMIFTGFGATLVGGPQGSALTGTWLIYDTVFGGTFRYGYGSAISFALFILITAITLVVLRFMNKGGE
ncbi:carbohydrate ABC transporter permease [Paenibacillus paeoniae]|uniref:Sugar ABC transporter permease n=1 Tax=Paenibacillus paeoniae TaxID=2292705 RepID=A0A371P5J1_9BACL|nr:sugar ABC transporter permease [Paenibacillus paeoniae]REK71207.1 sugar ABC transporter permease [Paenibacillus paeoniae]